jgi:hypothetical protein
MANDAVGREAGGRSGIEVEVDGQYEEEVAQGERHAGVDGEAAGPEAMGENGRHARTCGPSTACLSSTSAMLLRMRCSRACPCALLHCRGHLPVVSSSSSSLSYYSTYRSSSVNGRFNACLNRIMPCR